MDLKKVAHIFLYAIYSGLCIGIGAIVYLSVENQIVGGFMFTLGLLTILAFGFNLFTGKVGYIAENKPIYIVEVIIIWFGNFTGVAIMAKLAGLTRHAAKLKAAVAPIVEAKLQDNYLSLFVLAFFCGMLMFIAVDTFKVYKETKDTFITIIAVLCVVVFILAGFEHCIANMFYFVLSGRMGEAVIPLLVMTFGNAVGGNTIPLGRRIHKSLLA